MTDFEWGLVCILAALVGAFWVRADTRRRAAEPKRDPIDLAWIERG